jgi:maleamate amidohydrolase
MSVSDEKVYADQGFGSNIGFGRSPALLLVDFVNGFLDPSILGGGNIAAAAEETVPLLEYFRTANRPVIFSRIVYAADGSDASLWCAKVPRLRGLTEEAHDSQITAGLAPRDGEIVIRKTQASSFFGTPLAAHLVARGIDSLVVAGCTTSGCVRATVIDAMSYNYRTIVVTDCVGDRAIGPHESNLFDMGKKYSDLMNRVQTIAALEALPPASR